MRRSLHTKYKVSFRVLAPAAHTIYLAKARPLRRSIHQTRRVSNVIESIFVESIRYHKDSDETDW